MDIPVTHLNWIDSGLSPNIDEYCREGGIELVLMFANSLSARTEQNYEIRRLAVDFGIPLITNIQVAELFAESIEKLDDGSISLGPVSLQEHYADAAASK